MSIIISSNFQYNNDKCESKKEQYYSKSTHFDILLYFQISKP